MILFDRPMYPEQREKLELDGQEGIARLGNELGYQRSEAHEIVARTQFATHASVAGANAILAAMAKWEASVAEHRLQAARLVESGGPDDYVEHAMFATMELDQFLFWVRSTRAHLMTNQPMPTFQQPVAPAAAPTAAAGPGSADPEQEAYWKLVKDLQKKDAEAAKSLQDYTNSVNKRLPAIGWSRPAVTPPRSAPCYSAAPAEHMSDAGTGIDGAAAQGRAVPCGGPFDSTWGRSSDVRRTQGGIRGGRGLFPIRQLAVQPIGRVP